MPTGSEWTGRLAVFASTTGRREGVAFFGCGQGSDPQHSTVNPHPLPPGADPPAHRSWRRAGTYCTRRNPVGPQGPWWRAQPDGAARGLFAAGPAGPVCPAAAW